MDLHLIRFSSRKESTGGLLYINDEFFCFTVEDQYQQIKVVGETRIPAGRYEIKFRDAGGMNECYKKKYSEHIGMLHLQDVPDFEWIYIHPGNTDDHTEGCILPGFSTTLFAGEHQVSNSVKAYTILYNLIKFAIIHNIENVFITVEDS